MRGSLIAGLDSVAQLAELNPNAPALLEPGGRTLNYGELWTIIAAVRVKLQEAGISPDDIAAVLVPPGNLQILTVAGVLSHCVCAALQPRTVVSEVESSLRKLGASALIVSPEFPAEAAAAAAMGLTIVTATAAQQPRDWQIQRPAVPSTSRNLDPEVVLLVMTSATTGTPKVVPVTAASLKARIAARRDALKLCATDRQLLMTSFSHILGIENTLAQFLVGGSVVVTPGFDPTAYLDWLRNLRPTWYDCAPTVHQAALTQLRRTIGEKFSLRFVQSAGAPLPHETKDALEQVLGAPVFNDYGATEIGSIANDAFIPGGGAPNSAGRSRGPEIGIVNSCFNLLPPDRDGEIVVRGPALFSGYLDEPEANAALVNDGWFRTGDAGHLDAAGNLYIIGRIKEMINRGGEKIAPGEVDPVIASHPAVLEAAAFAVPHPTLGEDVACAVVLRVPSEQEMMTRELRRFGAQRLASYKIPRHICIVDQIPRGELGKPQRWLLSERFGDVASTARSLATSPQVPNETDDVLYTLYQIWTRVLMRDDLDMAEDFFQAGGDSLSAVNMLSEVDLYFGSHSRTWAANFLDEPTITHLAGLLRNAPLARPEESDLKIFPVRQRNCDRLLFCVPADDEEGLYFRRLAAQLDGQMNLSIVRPSNWRHSQTLFTLERTGAAMATLLRQTQQEGPYLVAGYCYGGLVALEAARQLLHQGQLVRLIFFDVPMPGSPSFVREWRKWLKRGFHHWRRDGSANDINEAIPESSLSLAQQLYQRVLWSSLLPIRSLLQRFENRRVVQALLQQAQSEYFPLYLPRPIDIRFLHFLSSDAPERIQSLARFGWRQIARGGVEERSVPRDHANLFHESNLPLIIDELRHWC